MYNCERQIVRVLGQLRGEPENYISEAIIVNNRSTDQGEQAVINYLQNHQYAFPIKVLRNNENYGLGGSHKVAFQYAMDHGFEYVITLHGDDQGHIADLLPCIKQGMHRQYDCLLGSRFLKGSKLDGYSKFRTFGNIVYNTIFSIATWQKIYDLGAGLNMYCVRMLTDHHYIKFADNLTFNYFGVLALRYYKQTFRFFPLVWSEDDQVSNVKMMSQAIHTLILVLEYLVCRKRFFTRDHRTKSIDKYAAQVIYTSRGQIDDHFSA